MMEFIKNSAFFGAMISLIAYEIGLILKKKFKMAIFNPLLISIICVIGVLLIFHIDYNDYNEGGKYISYLLTPATVCLAVPLYEQIHLLKKNLKAVAAGIISGTLAGLCSSFPLTYSCGTPVIVNVSPAFTVVGLNVMLMWFSPVMVIIALRVSAYLPSSVVTRQ